MSGTYDFINDLLETIKEQGFQYLLVILQEEEKAVRANIMPHITDAKAALALEQVLDEVLTEVRKNKKKAINKKKKNDNSK